MSVSPGWSDEQASSCGRPSSQHDAHQPSVPEQETLSMSAGAEERRKHTALIITVNVQAPIKEYATFSVNILSNVSTTLRFFHH